ncbi:MAG: response regulator transcription factor [Bacteroidales bacterium]|nr:response regulator transcription factor [Bacteroidales bacterium]
MQGTHSIFIADHNAALLDGLANIISQEPAFKVIGTARSVKELMDKAACSAPEIFLVDSDLPQLNGDQISPYFLRRKKPVKIIMLTDHWEKSLIKRIIALGVMGCLLKTCDADELIFAIHQVLAGKTYYPGFTEDQLNIFQKSDDINKQNNLLT